MDAATSGRMRVCMKSTVRVVGGTLEVRELERSRAHAVVVAGEVTGVAARARVTAVAFAVRRPEALPNDLHAVFAVVDIQKVEPLPAGQARVEVAAALHHREELVRQRAARRFLDD